MTCAGTPSAATTTSAPIDWEEFARVIRGDGPCNAERMRRRRQAHDDGAWVREAAQAYADKHAPACSTHEARAS